MAETKLTKSDMNYYIRFYPEYTQTSVKAALRAVQGRVGRLDAITVNHYIIEKRFGGKGMGKRKRSAR